MPFTTLTGVAAPLPEENVDTDIIFPARFLLITAREGLGRYAFHDRRAAADFVLNRAPFDHARILVAGTNFGCGSSREQAVWALLDRGIACVIAPSFGEIFHGNCFRNGVLPIVLPEADVATLTAAAEAGRPFSVDLAQGIVQVDDLTFDFTVPEDRKQALLNGWDETALILNAYADDIAAFETAQRRDRPWLHESAPA